MPSSLYSNDAGPSSASASSTSVAVFASIGLIGRNSSIAKLFRSPLATAPRLPASIMQRRPPDTDLRLPHRARQIRDGELDLVGPCLFQEIGEELDLGKAAGGGRHLVRSRDKRREKHA